MWVFHPFLGIHGLYAHVMPRLRIAALWPTWVFGKRPFFLKRIFMAKNAILMATIIRVNNSVFNILRIFV